MSPYSLQGLVNLTAHPILGPCVQSVSIGSYRLKKHLVNTQPHQDINHANAAALTQFRFEQTGLHLTLLARAFANLRAHGVTPMIGIFEDYIHSAPGNEVHNRGYGYDEFYGPIDIFRCGKTQTTQALVDLIRASLNAYCTPSGVSINLKWDPNDREAVMQHPGLFSLLQDLSIKRCGRLKSGKDLNVTLISANKIENRHHLEIRDQGMHLRLIRVSIDEYEGSPFPQLEPYIFGPCVNACYHARFERITLIDCDFGKSVSRFLRTHASCLRHLTLSSICFHDDESEDAVNLLLILRNVLALEKISLNHIIFINRHSSFAIFNEDLNYQEGIGSEQIFNLLDDAIERV